MKSTRKVLLLGSKTTRDYAILRSLARIGIKVTVSKEPDQKSPFLRSRYIDATITLPNKTNSTDWISKLSEHLDDHNYDLIIPPDDYTTHSIHENRWLQEKALINLPSYSSWDQTYNKEKTYLLADQLQISVPQLINIFSEAELYETDFSAWSFPLVIKPLNSKVTTRSGMIWLKHDIVRDVHALISRAVGILKYSSISIQQYCPGIGMGHGVLAHSGNILSDFQWIRVHEPPKGGASSYRKSIAPNPLILESSARLIEALDWTGVAMVEYRYDPLTKRNWLMEINGRFWGSLPLAIESGADFPVMLYQLLVEDKKEFNNVSYKTNIYCRNIQKDVSWFIDNYRASKNDPYLNRVPLADILKEPGNIIRGRERSDELHLDDPLPGIFALGETIYQLFKKVKRKLSVKFILIIINASLWLKLDRLRLGLIKILDKKKRILFLCFGNICRSPFAESACNSKMASNNLAWTSESAGIVQSRHITSPEFALQVSSKFGANLSEHTAKQITEEMINSSSCVMCMDRKNLADIVSRKPGAFYKYFLLGSFTIRSLEIPDPYRKEIKDFEVAYSLIDGALDSVVKIIK